jgi:DoxX-like family
MLGPNGAYVVVASLMSLVAVGSGVAKLRRDPHVVKVIHEVVRVPMKWFPWLAGCEFAGAAGLLIGIVWAPLGLAAAVGLIVYFTGAIVAHLRVGDLKGIGAPAFPFFLAVACLVTRILGAHAG